MGKELRKYIDGETGEYIFSETEDGKLIKLTLSKTEEKASIVEQEPKRFKKLAKSLFVRSKR